MNTLKLARMAKQDYDNGLVQIDSSMAFDYLVQECEHLQSSGLIEQLEDWQFIVFSIFPEFNY